VPSQTLRCRYRVICKHTHHACKAHVRMGLSCIRYSNGRRLCGPEPLHQTLLSALSVCHHDTHRGARKNSNIRQDSPLSPSIMVLGQLHIRNSCMVSETNSRSVRCTAFRYESMEYRRSVQGIPARSRSHVMPSSSRVRHNS